MSRPPGEFKTLDFSNSRRHATYGIKFGSNFQPEVGKRDVKDKESDLIREPEMVKVYRDT